jgi:hypothetical protein
MSRKRPAVEIAVTVGLFAFAVGGCIHVEPDPYPTAGKGEGSPIPDGVDYVRAVQCGGLMWAVQAAEYRHSSKDFYERQFNSHLASRAGLYIEWAQQLATQAGHDPTLARPDVAASRDMILASSGGISPMSKAKEIRETYKSDFSACSSMANHADADLMVIVGG